MTPLRTKYSLQGTDMRTFQTKSPEMYYATVKLKQFLTTALTLHADSLELLHSSKLP